MISKLLWVTEALIVKPGNLLALWTKCVVYNNHH